MFGAIADDDETASEFLTGGDGEVDALPGDLATGDDVKGLRSGILDGAACGKVCGKLGDFDGRRDNDRFPAVVFLNSRGGVGRNGDELINTASGSVVGAAQWFNQKAQGEASERIQGAESGILEIFVVETPVILGRNMAITDVKGGVGGSGSFDGFSFGAGDGNDKIISGEIKVGKVELAQGAEDFAEAGGKKVEPAGTNVGVAKPGDLAGAVLRGVNWGGRIHVMKLEEDLFGAARSGEPVAD